MRKCDFCNKEAIYICDFLGDEWIRIAGCEAHKKIAILSQENISLREEMRQRGLSFNQFTSITKK